MLRTCILCTLALFASLPGSAAATPLLAQSENGDTALLLDVLHNQSRPLLATWAPAGAPFGSPTPLTRPGQQFGVDRGRSVEADAQGGAVAAWIGSPPGDVSPLVALVSVKPPGGDFGPPQVLLDGVNAPAELSLDVNPRGDAVVVWNDYRRILYSYRSAGGSFGAPEPVPGPITTDASVVLEAGGGALFLGDDRIGPIATYRKPDGTFAPSMRLDGNPLYGGTG